jgi:hypothetical protein
MQATISKSGDVMIEQPMVKKVLFFTMTFMGVIGMELLFMSQMQQASLALIEYI